MEMLQPHPILLQLDTFLEHFMELKLCITYVFLNLRKSRVQCFKRCAIWIWNKEVMAVWRRTRKAEQEFCSRDAIWKGVSQLRNHPFHTSATLQRRTPILQLRNGLRKSPPLQNPPPAAETISKLQKWDAIFFFIFIFSFWLPNGYKNGLQASKWLRKCSRHQNGLRNSPLVTKRFRSPIATPCEILLLLWKWPFDCEMIFQTSKWL